MAIANSPQLRECIAHQTQRIFEEFRELSIAAVRAKDFPDWYSNRHASPDRERMTDQLGIAVKEFLDPRVKDVSSLYGLDEATVELELILPASFWSEIVSRIDDLYSAKLDLMGSSQFARFGMIASRRSSDLLALMRRQPVRDPISLGFVGAAGALFGGLVIASEGVNWHSRRQALSEIEAATLPTEVVVAIVEDTVKSLSLLVKSQVAPIEKYVT
jgi:hypothetical protein